MTVESARVRERFERLLAATAEIAGEHAVDAVLQKVADAARSVVGAQYAALGVINDAGTALSQFIVSGLTEELKQRIGAPPSGHGILGVLIRDARPVRLSRLGADPRSHGFPPNHPAMNSFLGVPIASRGRIFGNLYLTEKVGAGEFSDEDERIAVLFAAQAAAAIENAQLVERQDTMQRQRDQFFAMINHELRNALTGVYGWAEQLQRARSDESARRAGQEIYESAERTISLMNNLLDLSRLDAGLALAVFREHRLADILDSVTRAVTPAAAARRIEIHRDLRLCPETVHTDRMKLEQVLVNLLTNALRHSPPDDAITLACEATVDEILINVTDRGTGIAEPDQPKIFEPYVRVDPETGIGSGLGLPVARRLCELMGGRLSVHSYPGSGATFTVALPRRIGT